MKKLWIYALVAAVCLLAFTGSVARAGDDGTALRASLNGFQEIPSKLTTGRGTFTATISSNSISYTLTYAGLSTPAVASHIHFAQRGVNGGVFAFLCGGGGKPACPPAGGTVTGTITAADILAPSPDQGLAAGDFAGAVRALRSGNTYVNVHSTRFPAGEIRGQIGAGEEGNQ
jgi:CHRD domain-containing protein